MQSRYTPLKPQTNYQIACLSVTILHASHTLHEIINIQDLAFSHVCSYSEMHTASLALVIQTTTNGEIFFLFEYAQIRRAAYAKIMTCPTLYYKFWNEVLNT